MRSSVPLREWSTEYLQATFHSLWIRGDDLKLLGKIYDELKRRSRA